MFMTTFYFSGTGNTKWAVTELENAILKRGYQSKIYSIEEQPENLAAILRISDIIGIAFPIYAMNIPPIMMQFLHRLNDASAGCGVVKPLFVLTTVGYVDGCGPFEVVKQLPLSGLVVSGYTSIKLAINMMTPDSKAPPISSEEMKTRMVKGRIKIARLVEALASGKKKIEFGLYYFTGLTRKSMYNTVLNSYKRLSIDSARCDLCMKCADNCPSKCINLEDKKLVISSSCTACLRCYNFCPTASVLFDGKFAEPNTVIRYKGPETILNDIAQE